MRRRPTTISLGTAAMLTLLFCFPPAARAASVSTQTSAATPAAVVRLDGKIDDYSRDAFIKRFNQARAAGAKVVIVDLTAARGGLVTAALDLSRFLKSQTDVRTIASIGDLKDSAGAVIAQGCDETLIGTGHATLAAQRNYNLLATYAPSTGDHLIAWLNAPVARMLLMVLFALALYIAMHAPGHGPAEAVAMVALSLLVGVPMLTGHAQWWEILVILVGITLLAIEIFVTPGFGVLGLSGIAMVLFGLVMTFAGTEPAGSGILPTLPETWAAIRRGMAMVASALIASIACSIWLRRLLPTLPYFNRLILSTTAGDVGPPTESTLPDHRPDVGAIGEALVDLKPGGSATFLDPATGQSRAYSVVSDVGYVKRGTPLAVQSTADNRVVVRPVVVN